MARNFQVLDRDPSGAVWTLDVPAGDGFVAEPGHAYRIVVDAGTTLPAGTTVRRAGRDLKIRLPSGDEITIQGWMDTPEATLDVRGAEVIADSLAYAGDPGFLASGEPGVATAAAETGVPATAETAPASPAAEPPATATSAVITPPPAPAATPAPVASGGISIGGVLGGVALLGGLAAGAGGGGGSSSNGGSPPASNASAAPSELALAASSDSGVTGDRITNDSTPTITGRSDPNASITVRNASGAVVATATADAAGNWSATPTAALTDGAVTLQVVANRGGGAADSPAVAIGLTIDRTAPAAPVARLDPSSDGGTSGDSLTNDTTPTISGTGNPGDTIAVSIGGTAIGTTTVQANGSWSVTPATALAAGTRAVGVTATDVAGNVSAATSFNLSIDVTAPSAPTAALDPTSDSGVAGDNRTNDTTPTITGTAGAGERISLTVPGSSTPLETTAGTDGRWSLTPGTPLAVGSNTLVVTARDAAGNTSNPTNLVLVIDTAGPAAPAVQLQAASDSGVLGDFITNDRTPTLVGTGTAGDTIRAALPGGATLTTTVGANGTWALTPTSQLATGVNSISVTATNPGGNVSAPTIVSVTVDTTAPATPTLRLDASSDSGTTGDNRTNDTTPTFSGTGVAGDTITINLPAGTLTTTVAADGTWQATPAVALASGTQTITARATDAAGNTSGAASLSLTIDTTAPSAPSASLAAASDSGTLGDNLTNDSTPTIAGTGVAGDTIRVMLPSGTVLQTTVAANGSWSVTPTTALANGANALTITATDAAGNVSSATVLTLTIDTTPPSAPSAVLAPSSDSGTPGDNRTNDTTPTISGSATPGDTIRVTFPTGPVLSAVAAPDGSWQVTPASVQSNGSNVVSVVAVDAAGNTSTATSLTLTIDSGVPGAPTPQLAAASDSGTLGDNRTSDTTPTISGTGTAGDTISVTFPGGSGTQTTTVAANGSWSVTPPMALAEGPATITATATDAAGNVSPAGTLSITIDSTAPAAPSPSVAEGPLVNQAENADGIAVTVAGGFGAGDTVSVLLTRPDSSTTTVSRVVTAGEVLAGSAIVTVPAQTVQGAYSLQARITDAAANVGALSAAVGFTLDTQAPLAPSISAAEAADAMVNDAEATSGGGVPVVVALPVGLVAGDAVVLVLTRPSGGPATISHVLTAGEVAANTVTVLIPTATLATDGAHSLTASIRDAAGNTGAASSAIAFTLDRTGPGAPGAPNLTAASDSGVSSTDDITTDQTPTVSGSGAAAGATVNLYDTDGVTLLGTDTANGLGSWSITTSALSSGVHSLTARQLDAAGNLGAASTALNITVDRQGPAFGSAVAANEGFAPLTISATTLGGSDDFSATAGLRVTAATFVSGTGFAAGDLTIAVAGGSATITRDAGTTNQNGSFVLSVTMQDEAGNSTQHNVTVTVASVNDPPAGANASVTTSVDTPYVFGLANFALTDAADSPANSLQSVVLTTLPAAGQLRLAGAPVVAGQEISAANVAAGSLTFVPAVGASGNDYATFTFQVRDNGGTANGGIDLDPTPNTMTIDVAASLVLGESDVPLDTGAFSLVAADDGTLSLLASADLVSGSSAPTAGAGLDGLTHVGLELLEPTSTLM